MVRSCLQLEKDQSARPIRSHYAGNVGVKTIGEAHFIANEKHGMLALRSSAAGISLTHPVGRARR